MSALIAFFLLLGGAFVLAIGLFFGFRAAKLI